MRDLPVRGMGVGEIALETDGDRRFLTQLVLARRGERVRARVSDVEDGFAGGRGCRASGSADREADRLRVRVPRSCLDGPAWVRAGITFASLDEDADEGDGEQFTYSQDAAIGANAITRPGRLSPRIPRG